MHAPTHCGLTWPIAGGQLVIHDHEFWMTALAHAVTLVKIAPFEQRDLHDTKVIGADHTLPCHREIGRVGWRHSFHSKGGPKASRPHRNALNDRGVCHDGNRLDG